MIARVLASIVAALALFGSLPLWWWLHHRLAVPAEVSAGPVIAESADASEPQSAASDTTDVALPTSSGPSEAHAAMPAASEPVLETAAEADAVAPDFPAPSTVAAEPVAESAPAAVIDVAETAPPSE